MLYRKIIIAVLFIAFSFVGNSQDLANISDPRIPVRLPGLNGDTITLASQKGKVILLDFWASWCGPCRAANKHLVKLYDKYKSKGFEIFSVSLDQEKKDWQKAIAKDKMSWMHVIDPRGSNAKTLFDWNVSVIPTTFLINRKGDVVAIDVQEKELDKAIGNLLKEQ